MVDQAKDGPIKPSFALRFTLAFLYALSDGKDRGSYDGFWRCVLPPGRDHARSHSLYHQYAGDHLRGIAKSLGIDFEVELRERINRARGKMLTADRRKATALREAADEREQQKERARRARFCDLERVEPFPKD
jgi:hypothetical protein